MLKDTFQNQGQARGNPAGRPLIAVVDDDASFLRAVGRLLRSVGYAVEMFGSARQFLSALAELRPQCVVLDVHMPEMSGLQLQESLAAQGYSMPVIFVTAYDTPHTLEQARKAGSFGLLLKPFDNEALLRTIEEAMDHHAGNAEGDNRGPAPTSP